MVKPQKIDYRYRRMMPSGHFMECGALAPPCAASLGSRGSGRRGGPEKSGVEPPHSKYVVGCIKIAALA